MSEKKITCNECNAECCRNVAIEIDEPTTKEDWDDIRWQVSHKNIIVYLDNEDDWLIEFHSDCNHLDENNKCKIYDKRPSMCRKHDMDSCIKNGEGDAAKIMFRTIEDVEDYLAKKKAKKKFKFGK